MAQKRRHAPHPTVLEELESQGDKLGEFVQENIRLLLAVLVGSLVLAAIYAGYRSYDQSQETVASAAFSELQGEYLAELGASPGVVDLPELANPEAGRAVREEYVERFRAISREHAGTTAGTLAAIEVAGLQTRSGQGQAALETLQQALEGLPTDAPMRAVVLEHVAQNHETAERWGEAAEAHRAAGSIEGFELRWWALMDAARCYASAGEPSRALELLDRIEAEAPDFPLPDHMRALARDLRAAGTS